MSSEYDFLFKFLLIGDSGVGKSSIMLRFADNAYDTSFISTIGVDFEIKTIGVDGKKIKLQLWDTAGQERFRTVTRAYYRDAHGVIVVFDVTDQESFKNVREWLHEIDEFAADEVNVLLIGNKVDMADHREVTFDAAQSFADEMGIGYVETSAKSAFGVDEAFLGMAKTTMSRQTQMVQDKVRRNRNIPDFESKAIGAQDDNGSFINKCCAIL